jgi:hypothetical protein
MDELDRAFPRKLFAAGKYKAALEPQHRHHMSLALPHLEDVCLVVNAAHRRAELECSSGCGTKLTERFIADSLYCPKCQGVWKESSTSLTMGDRARLLELRAHAKFQQRNVVSGEAR